MFVKWSTSGLHLRTRLDLLTDSRHRLLCLDYNLLNLVGRAVVSRRKYDMITQYSILCPCPRVETDTKLFDTGTIDFVGQVDRARERLLGCFVRHKLNLERK